LPTNANPGLPVTQKHTSLGTEILLTLAILLGAALLFGGVIFLRYTEQNFLQQRIQMAHLAMQLIAQRLVEQKPAADDIDPRLLLDLPTEIQAENWWVFDNDLRLRFAYRSATDTPPRVADLRLVQFSREPYLHRQWPGLLEILSADQNAQLQLAVALGRPGSGGGVLAAQFSLEDILARLNRAQRWLLVYTLAFGTVLVVAGYFLIKRNVVAPTRKLLLATQHIAAGDLDVRLEKNGPREIYDLADSFNLMLDSLKQSREQTQKTIALLQASNTERQQTQNELVRSAKLASVGSLAAGMAHEIGNPLGALTGYLSLLQKDLATTPSHEIVRAAQHCVERMDLLIKDLLDYAAPEPARIESYDPWELLMHCVRRLELQGLRKRLYFDYEPNLTLPPVAIARHKLEQILMNLLLNSRDACDENGHISLSAEVKGEKVVLWITDNGCGIAAEQLAQIFDPFFTTKPPGQGRGLGLAVCQRLLAEVEGDIRCESVVGQGSRFCIELPRAKA